MASVGTSLASIARAQEQRVLNQNAVVTPGSDYLTGRTPEREDPLWVEVDGVKRIPFQIGLHDPQSNDGTIWVL